MLPAPECAFCLSRRSAFTRTAPLLRLQLLAERIYWDQASVLAQLGLIDTAGGGTGWQKGMGGRGSMWSGASRLVAAVAKEVDRLSGGAVAHRAHLRDRLIACLPPWWCLFHKNGSTHSRYPLSPPQHPLPPLLPPPCKQVSPWQVRSRRPR